MLEALSPVATFARGWSVSYTENGDAIRDPQQVNVGDSIATRVAKGWVTSTVSDRNNDPQPHVSNQLGTPLPKESKNRSSAIRQDEITAHPTDRPNLL